MNFATHPSLACMYFLLHFAIVSMMQSPIWNAGLGSQSLFVWWACEILVVSMQSCATHTSLSMDSIKFLMFCNSIGSLMLLFSVVEGWLLPSKGSSNCGEWLVLRTKGEKLVDAFMMFMISNQTLGNAWAQPFWFHSTWYHKHWTMVLFMHSDVLSVSEWYAVDSLCLIEVFTVPPLSPTDSTWTLGLP